MIDDPVAVAWAAGLFEGEGSIGRGGSSFGVRLTLGSTDHDVVERFTKVVECGRVRPRGISRLGRKPMLEWQVDYKPAEDILLAFLPFLGKRRAWRAHEVLSERAEWIAQQTRPRACGHCGEWFAPEFSSTSAQQKYCGKRCKGAAANVLRRERRRQRGYLERAREAA